MKGKNVTSGRGAPISDTMRKEFSFLVVYIDRLHDAIFILNKGNLYP